MNYSQQIPSFLAINHNIIIIIIPFTQSTKIGVLMSILALLTMLTLFTCETYAFLQTHISATIEPDPNSQDLIRLNFNVTLFDVHCDFVEVGK